MLQCILRIFGLDRESRKYRRIRRIVAYATVNHITYYEAEHQLGDRA